MSFEAYGTGEGLTGTVYGDTFKLIVVDDIRLSSRIGVGIQLLFTGCACTRNHSCVDDLELAIFLLTSLDEESSVAQLRLRCPCNHYCARHLIARRTEVNEFNRRINRQRIIYAIPRRAVIAVVPVVDYASYIPSAFFCGKFPSVYPCAVGRVVTFVTSHPSRLTLRGLLL